MNICYSFFLMILLSVASIGCSDNNVEWESDEIPSDRITFDTNGTLDLLHDESIVVKVLTGNGSYQVDSQDKDIAKAEMVGTDEIKVSAVSMNDEDQYTTIYVIDEKKQTAEIKVCVGKLKELQLGIPATFEIYTDVEENIQIVSGNGEYSFELIGNQGAVELGAYSEDTHSFSIKALKAGTAYLSITDKRDKQQNVTIQVKKADVRIEALHVPVGISLTVGSQYDLGKEIAIAPETASYKELSYTLLGGTVSIENGVLTALKPGRTVIHVKTLDGSNKEGECAVLVIEPGSQINATDWGLSYSSFQPWADGGNTDPYKMLNTDPADGWWEPGGSDSQFWVQVDLKYIQNIGKIRIARRVQWGGADINTNLKEAKVKGSEDGTIYTELGTIVYEDQGSDPAHDFDNGVWREVHPNAPTKVRYVRVVVVRNEGTPCIGCVNLYAPETD